MRPKSELLRIVRSPEGEVTFDPTGKKAGRGAYICNDPDCLKDPDCFYYSAGQCLCEKKENNGGYYSKLGDDDNVALWSSSDFEHISGCEAATFVWLVDFSSGEVKHEEEGYHNVRCVR